MVIARKQEVIALDGVIDRLGADAPGSIDMEASYSKSVKANSVALIVQHGA
jgi:hypothetical protein